MMGIDNKGQEIEEERDRGREREHKAILLAGVNSRECWGSAQNWRKDKRTGKASDKRNCR